MTDYCSPEAMIDLLQKQVKIEQDALRIVQETSIAYAGKQNARIAALEGALIRARDTFADMGKMMMLLQRPLVASACEVARAGCDEALGLTAETEVKSRMTHAEAIAMIRSDSRLRVDESPFKETACKHPLETMNHHGSVTGIVNDFRCTLCDLVMPLTDEEVSRWYGLHSKAETGTEHG